TVDESCSDSGHGPALWCSWDPCFGQEASTSRMWVVPTTQSLYVHPSARTANTRPGLALIVRVVIDTLVAYPFAGRSCVDGPEAERKARLSPVAAAAYPAWPVRDTPRPAPRRPWRLRPLRATR